MLASRISLVTLVLFTLFVIGCSTKAPSNKAAITDRLTEDPWPRVSSDLRKETDLPAARRTLEQLRIALSSNNDPQIQPASLTNEQQAALSSILNLSETELRELRAASYTPYDPNYLAECLYLRDVCRTLDVAGLPPDQQATVVFEWVCRQLVLQPWTTQRGNGDLAMPPLDVGSILLRGSGSGLDRAYVFLALTQQLGLDAVLIGSPESANRTWSYRADPSQTTAPPRGPFWAVGVRANDQIILFDPWRGQRFPTTFAELKAKPESVQAWRDDKQNTFTTTPADLATSVPFLCPPLSSLAPRWKRFETEFAGESVPLRLYFDLVARRQAFADATKLPPPVVWQANSDPYTPLRVGFSSTPKSDGGLAATNELRDLNKISVIPQTLFQIPAAISPRPPMGPNDFGDPGIPELYDLLRIRCITAFEELFLKTPTPRERFQRGQFSETIPSLIEKRKSLLAGLERLRTDRTSDETLMTWAGKIKDAYKLLLRARDKQDTNPAAVMEAQRNVEALMKSEATKLEALFDASFADAGNAEATYLLACGIHERAEQAHRRYEALARDPRMANSLDQAKENALREWGEARGWWSRYAAYAPTQAKFFLGRAEHAKKLADRVDEKISALKAR